MFLCLGAAFVCLGVCLPLFMTYKRALRPVLAALFKSLGTACALAIALVAALRLDPRCFICVAALALHMSADYALEFSFPAGFGLFLAGHVCYIAYFCQVYPLTSAHALCLLGFLAILAALLFRWKKAAGNQLPLFALYGIVLCLLAASAVGGGVLIHTTGGLLAAAGAALFFFSDALLCQNMLFPMPARIDWMVMITYYAAQLLLASSCMLL